MRPSTVLSADRIIVMHKGKVREMGTHRELLAAGGIYGRLYALQFEESGYPEEFPGGLFCQNGKDFCHLGRIPRPLFCNYLFSFCIVYWHGRCLIMAHHWVPF